VSEFNIADLHADAPDDRIVGGEPAHAEPPYTPEYAPPPQPQGMWIPLNFALVLLRSYFENEGRSPTHLPQQGGVDVRGEKSIFRTSPPKGVEGLGVGGGRVVPKGAAIRDPRHTPPPQAQPQQYIPQHPLPPQAQAMYDRGYPYVGGPR
jgi:hypothetical protein